MGDIIKAFNKRTRPDCVYCRALLIFEKNKFNKVKSNKDGHENEDAEVELVLAKP